MAFRGKNRCAVSPLISNANSRLDMERGSSLSGRDTSANFHLPYPGKILLCTFGRTSADQPSHHHRIRRRLFWVYILMTITWLIIFSTSTFYQSTVRHAEALAHGATDTSIIIQILDDVSWVSIMLRNLLILSIFMTHSGEFYVLTGEFDQLFKLVRHDHDPQRLRNPQRCATKLFAVSTVAVVMSSLLCITYWNHVDYSQFYSPWSLKPFPVTLTYWVVSLFMVLFAFIPFLMAQAVLSSIVGMGAGVLDLMTFVNGELETMTRQDAVVGSGNETDVDCESTGTRSSSSRHTLAVHSDRMEKQVALLRLRHFKVCRFVDEVSDAFSGILLAALVFDVVTALGFVGLIIGYKSSMLVDPTFDRAYQSLATSLWMVFFLCAEYWPLIRLHEEAEKTYHWVQALSLMDGNRIFHREMTHFLLATKNVSVGIVAGKLFVFSRNLCATMISLLCSFGLILYEILHKDKSGGLLAVLESGGLPASINETLNEESDFFTGGNVTGNATLSLSASSAAHPRS